MHDSFNDYINYGKSLADLRQLKWHMELDVKGRSTSGWNLTELVGSASTPMHYLKDFGFDRKSISEITAQNGALTQPFEENLILSNDWQDLIKAAVCDHLFSKKNSATHVMNNVVRPLKVIATCCSALRPWELDAHHIRNALTLSAKIQRSGKLADLVAGIVKNLIDINNISEACPIYPHLGFKRLLVNSDRKARSRKVQQNLLDELEDRKRSERLPEKKAFWELIRIVFTEEPRSFIDCLRFCAIKVMVICGLRIGEAILLPADWKYERKYYDKSGRSAGELGGFSKALMIRYFAEKQQTSTSDSRNLYETSQYIPALFEDILNDALDTIKKITQPLRETLRLQCETGRILPWYSLDSLVLASEIYTRISGNPIWLDLTEESVHLYVSKYQEEYDPKILNELHDFQYREYNSYKSSNNLNFAMYNYMSRLKLASKNNKGLTFRTSTGEVYPNGHKQWNDVYFKISELEHYLTKYVPTKLSDTKSYPLSTGELKPWELLFLMPKRSLSEARNGGITDISRYYAVGTPDTAFLSTVLGSNKRGHVSIFEKYGLNEEDRSLALNSHSLRHLQNTELFRLGVADTIITKRFNRKSVSQSYEYDHRSLSEELDSISIPPEIEVALGVSATTVAKMIKAGKANGPIVDQFLNLQKEKGDSAAFEYLRVEADGFHATPYGHCINSFTVDPCPKNLECFSGCRNLTATNLTENIKSLELLENKFETALSDIKLRSNDTIGKANQIAHAESRLEGIRKILSTPEGVKVFPDGNDLSKPNHGNPASVLNE